MTSLRPAAGPSVVSTEPVAQIDAAGSRDNWDPILTAAGGELFFSVSGNQFPVGGLAGAWSSADGVIWEPIDLCADAYLGGVAEGPDTSVLSGTIVLEGAMSVIGLWARQDR